MVDEVAENMEREQLLKKRIMRRVYFTYAVRRILNPLTVKAVLGVVLFGVAASFISIRNVIMNMPDPLDVGGMYSFAVFAFRNTETTVQLLTLLGLIAVFLSVRDMLRNLRVLKTA